MLDTILLALWFFAPAGAANVTPILVAPLPFIRKYNQPVDFGRHYRGVRILGSHKTWRGIISGTLASVLVVWLQTELVAHSAYLQQLTAPVGYSHVSVLALGVLLGFGALLGDAVESFFKRQAAIRPGHGWFPFDQTDYIVGGALLSAIVVRLEWTVYLAVIISWLIIHLVSSYLGWKLKLKDRPI